MVVRRVVAVISMCFAVTSCAEDRAAHAAPAARGEACETTLRCAPGLYCRGGTCAEPRGAAELRAVELADIEREIERTHELEAAAYTAQGRKRMQARRAELQAKLEAMRAAPKGESPTP